MRTQRTIPAPGSTQSAKRWRAAGCASIVGLLGLTLQPATAATAKDPTLIREFGLVEAAEPVARRAGWRPPRRIVVEAEMPELADAVRQAAPEATIVSVRTLAEMLAAVPGAEVAFGRAPWVCNEAVVATGTALRWLQTFGAGIEPCAGRQPLIERGVLVTNMRAICGPVMAEHVMGMLLALTRGLHVSIPRQAAGQWNDDFSGTRLLELRGKTLLVVGLGGIGKEVARLASAFDMRVIATRATRQRRPAFVAYVGLQDELPQLIATADVIVNTAPLTPTTRGLFDKAMFARMKPSALFINVARGGAVVTDDLADALESRRIGGGAVDVTDPEPLPAEHRLWRAPNLIVTPHMSAGSDGCTAGRLRLIRENLRRYVAGERMLSVADVVRGY